MRLFEYFYWKLGVHYNTFFEEAWEVQLNVELLRLHLYYILPD